jgi:hypothetical protein
LTDDSNSVSTLERVVGTWYWIGTSAGLGAALGVLAVGVLRDLRVAFPVALVAAAAVGWLLAELAGAVAGGIGGVLGTVGAAPTVHGALARGGTRSGTALLVAVGALVLAALSFVPVLGYLVALAVPVLGLRARRRAGERHAGLRILARD